MPCFSPLFDVYTEFGTLPKAAHNALPSGTRHGAQVAPQRCPILRGGKAVALYQLVRHTDERGSTIVTLFWYRDGSRIAYLPVSRLLDGGIGSDSSIDVTCKLGNANEPKDSGLDRLYSYVVPSGVSDDDLYAMSSFRVVLDGNDGEDIYVIWTQAPPPSENSPDCVELYATAYIGSSEGGSDEGADWSRPYRLTNAARIIDEPAVAVTSDGKMITVYNQYRQEITDDPYNPVLISDLKLVASSLAPCGSVDVTEIAVSDSTPMPGDPVRVTITVENTGLTIADGYEMRVFAVADGKRTEVFTTVSDTPLRPGASAVEAFDWEAPADPGAVSLYAQTMETGGSWSNLSAWEVRPFALDAEMVLHDTEVRQSEEGMLLCFRVGNTGNVVSDSDDMLRVTQTGPFCSNCGLADDEHVFADVSLAGIAPGEVRSYEVLLNAPVKCFAKFGYVDCCVNLVKDGEDLPGRSVTVRPVKPLAVYINGSAVPGELRPEAGDRQALEAATMPAAAVELSFVSSDERVAYFEDGQLVAAEPGVAVLTGCIMPSGIELPPITVTVTGSKDIEPVSVIPGGFAGAAATGKTGEDGGEADDDAPLTEEPADETPLVNPFVDVSEEDYFYAAVLWAAENGVTQGTDDTHFSPNAGCTRAQMVTMLWRAAGSPEPTATTADFTDVDLTDYYGKALLWAVENGITNGVTETAFAPEATVNRGQAVTFLYRMAKVEDIEIPLPFTDVDIGGYDGPAIMWAYDNGITNGTSATTFSPEDACTRAQIVTLLCRYFTGADRG